MNLSSQALLKLALSKNETWKNAFLSSLLHDATFLYYYENKEYTFGYKTISQIAPKKYYLCKF